MFGFSNFFIDHDYKTEYLQIKTFRETTGQRNYKNISVTVRNMPPQK